MAEQAGTPCVWDGVPEDEHGTRYAAGIGDHEYWFDWTRPAKARPQLLDVRRAEADALATAATQPSMAEAAKQGRVVSVEPVRTPVDEAPEWIEVAAVTSVDATLTPVDHATDAPLYAARAAAAIHPPTPAPEPWWRRILGSRT